MELEYALRFNPKITKNEISNITNFLSPSILIENKELQFKNNKIN